MSEYKEFFGKSVDEAIEEACSHFSSQRDKLEIEIQEGGSAGIFGLVGAKKAMIKARLRDNRSQLQEVLESIMQNLMKPINPDCSFRIDINADPISIVIDDEENSGLLIGREGQTLAGLQYIVNRIVSKQWPEKVRVQLDTGDYREKQNENLKSTARYLAKKAKDSGRVQSTKPLTSFHRRLVHMTLQKDSGVQTKSKGDGPMKRVLILPKRSQRNNASQQAGAQ